MAVPNEIPVLAGSRKRNRGPTWSAEETNLLVHCKQEAVKRRKKGKEVWQAIAERLSEESLGRQNIHARTSNQCRGRWDTLKKVYDHIEAYCTVAGYGHEKLEVDELKSMKLKTEYNKDWYSVLKEVCDMKKLRNGDDPPLGVWFAQLSGFENVCLIPADSDFPREGATLKPVIAKSDPVGDKMALSSRLKPTILPSPILGFHVEASLPSSGCISGLSGSPIPPELRSLPTSMNPIKSFSALTNSMCQLRLVNDTPPQKIHVQNTRGMPASPQTKPSMDCNTSSLSSNLGAQDSSCRFGFTDEEFREVCRIALHFRTDVEISIALRDAQDFLTNLEVSRVIKNIFTKRIWTEAEFLQALRAASWDDEHIFDLVWCSVGKNMRWGDVENRWNYVKEGELIRTMEKFLEAMNSPVLTSVCKKLLFLRIVRPPGISPGGSAIARSFLTNSWNSNRRVIHRPSYSGSIHSFLSREE